MKTFVLLLTTTITGNAFALDQELTDKYHAAIVKLENSCSGLKPYKVPKTINEIFCSASPINQISVRYCVYQNMLNPKNDQSITFVFPEKQENWQKTSQIKVATNCRDIKI